MNDELKRMKEEQTATEDIFRGQVLHLQLDLVTLPNGKLSHRELVRHIGAVCIVPVTDDGKVIVERQYRYPIDMVITEIPAGKLDSKDEDPLEAAKRELREETGYTADQWQSLGVFYPAPAYSDEKITMFLAKGLHEGACDRDDDEFLDVMAVPMEDLLAEIAEGKIPDAKTQMGILRAARILGK